MPTTVRILLSSALITAAGPALAQYGAQAPQQPKVPAGAAAAQATPAAPAVQPSRGARNAIIALQTAVRAKNAAAIPTLAAAAKAVAKTPADNYLIARLELQAAIDSGNEAAMATAVQAVLASNYVSPAESAALHLSLGKIQRKANQFDQAAASFERAIALDPKSTDAFIQLGETRNSQNRPADAVAALQRAIAASVSSGIKPPEAWYQRTLAIAYKARLPVSVAISRDWVAAYPSPEHWRDALRIYRNLNSPDEQTLLDLLRLQRATNSLAGEGDFHEYSMLTLRRGQAIEAKAVLDEAAAAKVNVAKPLFAETRTSAAARAPIERNDLAADHAKALAAPAARSALRVGDSYYGVGDYAKAAELYRAALSKQGADKDLINLHLGMALARAGDKAGATAALNAVTGARAELAKYWLLYVSMRP